MFAIVRNNLVRAQLRGDLEDRNHDDDELSQRIQSLTTRIASFERDLSRRLERLEDRTSVVVSKKKFFNSNEVDWSNFDEIIAASFEYLDVQDLFRASRVCSNWNKLTRSNSVCRKLLSRENPQEFSMIMKMPRPSCYLQLKYNLAKGTLANRIGQSRDMQKNKMICWIAQLTFLMLIG